MKRLIATAAVAALAPLAFATPAHAETPYEVGDLSTLPACAWNYWRVVSIAEGLAPRIGDLEYQLQQAQETNEQQAATIADQAETITHQAATIERKSNRIERLRHRIAALRARLARS